MAIAWDEETDLIVVGSGAGSSCAALQMREAGQRAIVLEKEEKLGGSSAMSACCGFPPILL